MSKTDEKDRVHLAQERAMAPDKEVAERRKGQGSAAEKMRFIVKSQEGGAGLRLVSRDNALEKRAMALLLQVRRAALEEEE